MNNSFGNIFKITTFGESHGDFVGVVIDGCPSNIEINEKEINFELKKRRPNLNEFVTRRKEEDKAQIVSGVFNNKTTGAPICILVKNKDVDSSYYDEIKDVLRPSHANFTYIQKYKNFDHRGASRASARETVGRVAASVVAKKILEKEKIEIFSYIKSIGDISVKDIDLDIIDNSPIFCPDKKAEKLMIEKLKSIKEKKDSIGGVVEFIIKNCPVGLGDPIYNKLNAKLSFGLMSIPAAKAIEIGDGVEASKKIGSMRNDSFSYKDEKFFTKTNNEGGILAGISTGMPIYGRVFFKPSSTINLEQETVDIYGKKQRLNFADNNRSDICVAIRAASVVKAMCYLVLVDSYLMHKAMREDVEKVKC